ncbi:MAG TPA: sensor histidine kinase [Miltoncostaeaceae bacterium]|nr:sensor histidine kinase [Miltoncostaeaceae bacterium]
MLRLLHRTRALVERFWLDALTVLLALGAIIEILTNDQVEGPTAGLIIFVFLWTTPLLFRRRHPVLAPVLVFVAVTVQAVIWHHSVPYQFFTFAAVLISAGMLGMNLSTRRDRILGGALAIGTLVTVVALDPGGNWTDVISTGGVIGVAWLVGHIHRANTTRNTELRERAERLEREREANARAAVAEERTRIAREMHDVVAHSLSVMVVQAEAAEEMIGIDPERARKPLSAVQETGRGALTELRRMLGVLREMDEGPDLAPQPGLAGLGDLVEHVRDAGLPVELRVEGEPRPLSPTGDLQAYRIVQEALTNALKHAGPARAQVLVRYEADDVVIAVTDDGRGYDPATDGRGHGLIGMRERVAVCGGEMSAGRRPQGGFEVVARLPVGEVVAR